MSRDKDDCQCPACTTRRAAQAAFSRGDYAEGVRTITEFTESRSAPQAAEAAEAKPVTGLRAALREAMGRPAGSPAEAPAAAGPVAAPNSALKSAERTARKPVEQYLVQDVPATAWTDIVGNEEARNALVSAVEHPITQADLYAFYGRKPPRGALLHGAPGCGKTMLARAVASNLRRLYPNDDAPAMLQLKGPEIQTPLVGQTESIVRSIFAYAKAYRALYGRPLVIFLDEADALLPNRNSGRGPFGQANSWEETCVATFLAEMDGLSEAGAFVLLATNRPNAVDEAVLRPGRIDVKIQVERPNREACVTMLTRNLSGVPVADIRPADELAARAVDYLFTPAHVLTSLNSDKGPLHLTMRHIISGALVNSVADVAKENAFTRDLLAGKRSGLVESDLTRAVDTLVKQNEAIIHRGALEDLCIAAGVTMASTGPLALAGGEEDPMALTKAKVPVKQKLN